MLATTLFRNVTFSPSIYERKDLFYLSCYKGVKLGLYRNGRTHIEYEGVSKSFRTESITK
jgi:hypothetical protein